MLNWLKKTWTLLVILIAAVLICGPYAQWTAQHLGPGFAGPALVIDNLAGIGLILLVLDLVLDCRERWGIFPSLDLNKALDVVIKGEPGREGERYPSAVACALVYLGTVALIIAILFLSVPRAGAATLDNARPHLPVLSGALDRSWPAAPLRHITAGQVEQESSWKEHATLKTPRELGQGLVQMTIAYDKNGRERFNIFKEATRAKALKDWDWRRDPYNVAYQLTFLVLTDKGNFAQVRPYCGDDEQAWRCALVCYNAGPGRWLSRLRNARRQGLPTDRWEGGLDRAYGKGETALLYGRPLYLAVNEYPRVIFNRAAKYRGLV
jgi:hypothetical protein